MSRWRILVILTLFAAPVLVYSAVGTYELWRNGLALIVWCPLLGCMILALLLGWHWQRKQKLLPPPTADPPMHWTERDREAWQFVENKAREGAEGSYEKLGSVEHYLKLSQELAQELARFYYPRASDPLGGLTVPEVLAVFELATHDLAEMVDHYLPGGHLLTIDDWRRARRLADWYDPARNAYWAVSALFSPINTTFRYLATQLGLTGPMQLLQQNLLVWFHTAYVHRIGVYLIELLSGRLRIGAQRYRELLQGAPAKPAAAEAEVVPAARRVTLGLVGQVKAGKSSLVNALLGERWALTDVLPATSQVQRYRLEVEGVETQMALLDTVGYGHEGPKADQFGATFEAAKESDLLLLVLRANDPAREPDLKLLRELRTWFNEHPELRRPAIVAVLTHIDLLSPSLEWSPPYDWRNPKRPKEQNIARAIATVREQLGEFLASVVPVCVAPGKVYGIEETLLPVLLDRLDEAHAVGLLRCLKAERDKGKVRKVFEQLLAAGKEATRAVWEAVKQ
jgi:predicted GTPase